MRSLITIVLICFSFSVSSQNTKVRISQGFDVSNAFVGGKKLEDGTRRNPKAFAYFGRVSLQDSWWEAGLSLQVFSEIDYKAIGVDFNHIAMDTENVLSFMDKPLSSLASVFSKRSVYIETKTNLQVLYGLEASIVSRKGLDLPEVRSNYENLEYYNYSANLRLRLDNIGGSGVFAEYMGRLVRRNDIYSIWEGSTPDSFIKSLWDNKSSYFSVGYSKTF